ncbi:MAG: glutamate-5-semialdehyde dehydrogenase, partial [Lysobacterales bacterium]
MNTGSSFRESHGDGITRRLEATREASRRLLSCPQSTIDAVLLNLADRMPAKASQILEANRRDLARLDPADPKYDRLLLNEERLKTIADDLRTVAALASPVGDVLQQQTLQNGLELSKIRVPMGVIAVIFESRPNVTFDVFALCLK